MLALPRHEAVYSNLFLLMSFSDSSCFNKVSWLQKGNSVIAGESSKFLLPVWTEHALCCERWSSAPGRAERLCGLKFIFFVRGFISHGESVSESVWPLFLTSSINRHLWEEAEGLWCGIRWKPLVPPLQVVCEAPLFSPATHAHSQLACLQLQSAVQCEVGRLRRISGFRFSSTLVECSSLLAPVIDPPCSRELY